jgi:vacuolar-type H+-ATPase subunit E/Vma4
MTVAHRDVVVALAPLVAALRSAAEGEAQALVGSARAEAQEAVSAARAQADRMLARAREKGTADGEAVLAAERARAEREARGIVLRAAGDAYEASRRAAREAVSRLKDDPDFAIVDAALRSRARAAIGDDASLTEAESGGIIATVPGRRLDLSLASLADDLVEAWPSDDEGPWST